MLKTALIAAALCTVTSAFADTNLIQNGSFESDIVAAGTYSDFATLTGGWVASYGTIEVRNDLIGTAQDGVNYVELDSTANSAMYQTITTVIGESYTLSFYVSDRAESALNGSLAGGVVTSASNGLNYSYGTGIFNTVAGTNTTDDNVWNLYSVTFTATSTSTTISFAADGTSDSFGTSLDNVAVTAVPEPAELAMMGAGLLVVAGLARRRNRQA